MLPLIIEDGFYEFRHRIFLEFPKAAFRIKWSIPSNIGKCCQIEFRNSILNSFRNDLRNKRRAQSFPAMIWMNIHLCQQCRIIAEFQQCIANRLFFLQRDP